MFVPIQRKTGRAVASQKLSTECSMEKFAATVRLSALDVADHMPFYPSFLQGSNLFHGFLDIIFSEDGYAPPRLLPERPREVETC